MLVSGSRNKMVRVSSTPASSRNLLPHRVFARQIRDTLVLFVAYLAADRMRFKIRRIISPDTTYLGQLHNPSLDRNALPIFIIGWGLNAARRSVINPCPKNMLWI